MSSLVVSNQWSHQVLYQWLEKSILLLQPVPIPKSFLLNHSYFSMYNTHQFCCLHCSATGTTIIQFSMLFSANFHFALVGHLLKGFRHPTPTTVSRTSRVLTSLLTIVAKPFKRDKFEVTTESVAYLAGNFYFYHMVKQSILMPQVILHEKTYLCIKSGRFL